MGCEFSFLIFKLSTSLKCDAASPRVLMCMIYLEGETITYDAPIRCSPRCRAHLCGI